MNDLISPKHNNVWRRNLWCLWGLNQTFTISLLPLSSSCDPQTNMPQLFPICRGNKDGPNQGGQSHIDEADNRDLLHPHP